MSEGRGAAPGAPGGVPRGARHAPPRWLFWLGMAVLLEPPLLVLVWLVDHDLGDRSLAGIAMVGGLFVSLPALAIFGLAVGWDRRLAAGDHQVPGLPAALTGPRASRLLSAALIASTVLMGCVCAALTGPWAVLALPPLALSFASARLLARAA